MKKILVIGASGFLGRHVTLGLLAAGYVVRCLARNLARVEDLAAAGYGGCARGHLRFRVDRACARLGRGCLHLHSYALAKPASTPGQGFMDVERHGLENIVAACRTNGVRRLIYVTFLGISPDRQARGCVNVGEPNSFCCTAAWS